MARSLIPKAIPEIGSGNNLPAVVLLDTNGNVAVGETKFVQNASGILIPEPIDLNSNPITSPVANRPQSELTTTPLGASATYTQAWQDAQTLGVNYVTGSVVADQTGTLNVDFADDQTYPLDSVEVLSFTPGTPGTPNAAKLGYAIHVSARYFRFRYVNGATAQGTFELFQTATTQLAPQTVALSGSSTPLTDRSGTITTGGTSQTLAAANTSRKVLFIYNPSSNSDSLWVNFGTAAVESQPSFEIVPGASLKWDPWEIEQAAVNIIAATTGDPFVAKEG